MRRFLLAIVLVGCAKHASRDQAQAACEHRMELGYWHGFEEAVRKNGLDPDDPAVHAQGAQQLPVEQATDAWKAQLSTCTDDYADKASPDQTACIIAATTSDAARACIK